jgi:biotin synthase
VDLVEALLRKALSGIPVSRDEALGLCDERVDIYDLMHAANRLRRKRFGNKVRFCSIVNARSGACPNDCSFCAQSSYHATGVDETALIDVAAVLGASREAARNGAASLGLVTSGVGLSSAETEVIAHAARSVGDEGMLLPCASLGELDEDRARTLYDAGIRRYHHNLETSERFYPHVCTTYDYRTKLRTLRTARAAGMRLCCGGIFGLGESWEDRVDMAMTIRGLNVDSVPLNFLRPIPGTPLGDQPPLEPLEALRIIAVYRFMFPKATIKVCGGREYVLRDVQSMFYAGANGAMLGNYLTTSGRAVEDDLWMVHDLDLELDTNRGADP